MEDERRRLILMPDGAKVIHPIEHRLQLPFLYVKEILYFLDLCLTDPIERGTAAPSSPQLCFIAASH